MQQCSIKEFFAERTVLVMGLGRFGGGSDSAEFAAKAGANVIVTDLAEKQQLSESVGRLKQFANINFHLGQHWESDFQTADIIIVNPAVPGDSRFLKIAARHKKVITSQVSLFFRFCPAPTIGVTGTNGKSTTAALTAHLLRAGAQASGTNYSSVRLGGNIGNAPLLTVLDQIGATDLVVLELSSFHGEQLAEIGEGPDVAVLTNLVPNHLDRHGTFANYCAAKENIFKFQNRSQKSEDRSQKTEVAKQNAIRNTHDAIRDTSHGSRVTSHGYRPAVSVFNAEDEIGTEWFEKYASQKNRVCLKFSAEDLSAETLKAYTLPGPANRSNLAAAVCVARYFGVTDENINNSLPYFKPLPYRLELVAEKNGIRWYNDSISTTPESTIAALDAFEQPKIIIAGGYDKHLCFDHLGRHIGRKCKAAILIGATAETIASAIRNSSRVACDSSLGSRVTGHGPRLKVVDSLADAVDSSAQLAVSGDVVLLSPACASYDMFDNFEHRGREFIRLVQALKY